MTKILKAQDIIDSKIDTLKLKSQQLRSSGKIPKLKVILVGQNSASLIYIRNKRLFCQKIGAEFELIELAEDISKSSFLSTVEEINNDDTVTGFFVQLPISKHLEELDITQLINPSKDVDGFHLSTITNIYRGNTDGLLPCTPKGILGLFEFYNIDIASKHIVIIGRSFIVGKPLSLLLNAMNATVTLCHSKTVDLAKHTLNADIIISAVGQPHFLREEFFKTDNSQILIDVGISRLNNKTVGDIDFHNVKDQVQAITPVPGGIGPLTVLSLMENLIQATENK